MKNNTTQTNQEKINEVLWQLISHTSPLSTKDEFMAARPEATKSLLSLVEEAKKEGERSMGEKIMELSKRDFPKGEREWCGICGVRFANAILSPSITKPEKEV